MTLFSKTSPASRMSLGGTSGVDYCDMCVGDQSVSLGRADLDSNRHKWHCAWRRRTREWTEYIVGLWLLASGGTKTMDVGRRKWKKGRKTTDGTLV